MSLTVPEIEAWTTADAPRAKGCPSSMCAPRLTNICAFIDVANMSRWGTDADAIDAVVD
jgi:hypothetical protein